MKSYAIIGTGAVGGYYGGMLARAGFEVHFLAHSDVDHIRAHGLLVESKDGDFRLPHVRVYGRGADMPMVDVAVVALKTTQNAALRSILPGLVKPDGVVLTLQNGLGIEDELATIVGPDRVIGGLCFICSNKIGPGHIRHLDYGDLLFGDYDPAGGAKGITTRLQAIQDDFARAGLPARLSEDLLLARWKKLVWNIPYNGLSVVLRVTTDRIMADPQAGLLVREIMEEVVDMAAGFGRVIEPAFVQKMLDDTVRMKPYRTSMMIDFEAGRPMEIEAIYGNPLRLAAKAGRSAPRIEMLYCQLKFLDGTAMRTTAQRE